MQNSAEYMFGDGGARMVESQRGPISSLGDLIRVENGGPELVQCPRCGVALQVIGGGHCSGLRDDGSRWTGGRDWLNCNACGQWFVRVYSSFRVDQPPRRWEACDPPQFL